MNTINNLGIPVHPPGQPAGGQEMSELASAAANAAAVAASAMKAAAASAAATELYGSFLLGPDEFALSAVCIREVVNLPSR